MICKGGGADCQIGSSDNHLQRTASVELTSPVANAIQTAPASFTLTASATDSDGAIEKVEFYNGATLLGTATAAPYSVIWSNVPVGTYSLTARATDNQGAQTSSAPVDVTVKTGIAQAYYIHTDHLDTPRMITDTAGHVVWQWDNSDPFGGNVPNENPAGQGTFTFNLRFPGQYFDRETNLNYNVNRDYDPATGRYVQSDPVGLAAGVNTYGYVDGNPISFVDPLGLAGILPGPIPLPIPMSPIPMSNGSKDDGSFGGLFPPGTMSSSNGYSSSSDTYDSSGQKVCSTAQSMKPPGNCSENEQKQMQKEVDQACGQQRACRPGMDQITIQINISNGMRCALARNAINNKCFAGGDLAHRNEAIRVWNTIAQCQGMAK